VLGWIKRIDGDVMCVPVIIRESLCDLLACAEMIGTMHMYCGIIYVVHVLGQWKTVQSFFCVLQAV